MKFRGFLLLIFISLTAIAEGQTYSTDFNKSDVKEVMRKVADWQIKHQPTVRHQPLGWVNAAMYLGMYDWSELAEATDNEDKYRKSLLKIFNKGGWQPEKRMYLADDICVSQIYIDFYRKDKKAVMINPTICRTDWVMDNPGSQDFQVNYATWEGLDSWTWCDALFMAPPVYAKLYNMTGKKRYIEYMNDEFMKAYDFLYDKEEDLFYRDYRYVDKKEANGEKVFWGRGNGWVMGGLVELLQELPRGDRNRTFYEVLFTEMCDKLITLQQADGYYRASLLDPKSYPSPETSATGFIIYAFAYGVNEGILPADKYMPAIKLGWKALVDAVEKDGKLGYVQPIGADPRSVTRDMTEPYGVGAFLLTGNQIYKMSK